MELAAANVARHERPSVRKFDCFLNGSGHVFGELSSESSFLRFKESHRVVEFRLCRKYKLDDHLLRCFASTSAAGQGAKLTSFMSGNAIQNLVRPGSSDFGIDVDCRQQKLGELCPFRGRELLGLLEYGFHTVVHNRILADQTRE